MGRTYVEKTDNRSGVRIQIIWNGCANGQLLPPFKCDEFGAFISKKEITEKFKIF